MSVEPAFLLQPEAAALTGRGHNFGPPAEIRVATAIEFLYEKRVLAAVEPVRRGGGSALVVNPKKPK
jgi:gamma-glutamyltranspeptidase/glutathione hydrolase